MTCGDKDDTAVHADADTDTDPTTTVCDDGVAPYALIQDAVDAASDGDVITICAGTYTENVVLDGADVSLEGVDGAAVTNIDGGGRGSVLRVTNGQDASTSIRGLTLTNGDTYGADYDDWGGGLFLFESSPTVSDMVIEWNEAGTGGGIAMYGSDSVITHVDVSYNVADDYAGAIYIDEGSPELGHLTVSFNEGNYTGGLNCWMNCSMTLYNSIFTYNQCDYGIPAAMGTSSSLLFNLVAAYNSGANPSGTYALQAPVLYNSISYENDAYGIGIDSATTAVEYNLAYQNSAGNFSYTASATNLTVDPRFVDSGSGDFTLDAFSPAIDVGNPASAYDDLDGSRNDLGVYGGAYGSW